MRKPCALNWGARNDRARRAGLMRAFAALYSALDESNATRDKVDAMLEYFRAAAPENAAWAVHVLTGGKLKRLVRSSDLREWASAASGYPLWLVDETYAHVGDLAETITLLTPRAGSQSELAQLPLHQWIEDLLQPLTRLTPAEQGERVRDWWAQLPRDQVFVLCKLLTGSLRVGVSQRLVVQALAKLTEIPGERIAHRLTGTFVPTPQAWITLVAAGEDVIDHDQPYPFFLASPLEQAAAELGDPADWLAEWKWDGIRAQLLRRGGVARLWSRGEERLDGRFPEIEAAACDLGAKVVLDGEILGWENDLPLPFSRLQKRIGRLKPGPKSLADCPVVFMAYDLIELQGEDWRTRPLYERRAMLKEVLAPVHAGTLRVSPALESASWEQWASARLEARERGVEGLILKRLSAPYLVGRRRGDWWKWKIDPFTIDAVLIYAQSGHGRRSTLFTDYTFALWDQGKLVPVAKAYSGLDDSEISRLDRWIRTHTIERFGPVRSVQPVHVFELAFEAVNRSSRHKSGIAVRFPRILRWRTDKLVEQADTLETLAQLAG